MIRLIKSPATPRRAPLWFGKDIQNDGMSAISDRDPAVWTR